MPELHFLHGINIGLRWKFERASFEIGWERMNRTSEAIGENSMDQLYQKTIFYGLNSYTAALESNFNNFGLGIALGLRNFEVKEEIASTGKKGLFWMSVNISSNHFLASTWLAVKSRSNHQALFTNPTKLNSS